MPRIKVQHRIILTSLLALALPLLAAASPLASIMGGSELLSSRIQTLWNDQNGLPTNTVLDIVQDRDGYIWIASYDGLIRFDGSSFTTFSDIDGRGFSAESARELALGRDGRLWIGTNDKGVYAYEKGAFRHYGAEDGLEDLSIRAMGFDASGDLLAGTAKGVFALRGDRFAKLEPAGGRGAEGFGIASFFVDVPGLGLLCASNFPGLWIAKPDGLSPWEGAPGELASCAFSAAAVDPEGVLWLGTNEGAVFRLKDGKLLEKRVVDRKEGASVNAFLYQSDRTMRIGTDKGIVSCKDGEWSSFSTADGLPNDVVSSLCEDRELSLWVGTERGGLVKYSAGKFVTLGKEDGLADAAVNATAEDSFGSLWVATDSGVSFHASDKDPIASDRARAKAVDELVKGLKGVRVRQIRLAKDGSLWFATYSERSLIRFDGLASVAYGKKEGLPSDRVRMSCEASDGSVLAGTTAGLAIIGPSGVSSIGPAQGLPNHYVMDVTEEGGAILAATDGSGVATIRGGKAVGLADKASGLAGNVVFRFFRDSGQRLWVCTGEGVSLWEGGKSAGSVTVKTGLPWPSVFQMIEPEEGILWLVSSKGVAVVEAAALESMARGKARDLKVRVIDRRDGLAGQLSANAWACRNPAGRIYLPTLAGVSIYDAALKGKNEVSPPVRIESVEVDGDLRSVLPDKLRLRPGTQRATFRFAALSFALPSKVSCRYRLEGYDPGWIDGGTERSVSYTNLPPGDYAFRVTATNDDGVSSEREARIELSQEPFFWQTWPFYLVAALVLAGAGFLAAFARLRKLEGRRRELERVVQERTRDLEEEKATSEALLLNILPYRVAEELKKKGSSAPQLYPDATVLFADLVGFTEACATLSPERTIEELNSLFTAFDDIVAESGGERIKTIGDAYLASAGMDGHDPEHSYRMCQAAREIMRALEARASKEGLRWGARIGIHSGSIVGGVVGVRKYIYDIFGDTVNIASRLQSSSVPGGICVSRLVADRVRPRLPVVDRPPRALKGLGELPMSFIAWRSDDPGAGLISRAAYDEGIRSCAEGRYDKGLACLEEVDYALIEPEAGALAWKTIASCRRRKGDEAGAAQALRQARSFGISDIERAIKSESISE